MEILNLIVALTRIVWFVIRITAPFIVFGVVYSIIAGGMSFLVRGAFLGDLAVLMVAGVIALFAGFGLASVLWRR